MACQSPALKPVHRPYRLLQRNLGIHLVYEVEIEHVDAEPLKTRLRRAQRSVAAEMGLPDLSGEKEP